MAARTSLLANRHQTIHRARDRSPHEQQVPLGVDLYDPEPELGEVARTHVAGHALPFDDPRRVGTRRNRPRLAMPRIAVCLRTAAEMMAVHHALEAAALRHAPDLHP